MHSRLMGDYKGYVPIETQQALGVLEKLRDLVISYAGFSLQDPEMFPQPPGYDQNRYT